MKRDSDSPGIPSRAVNTERKQSMGSTQRSLNRGTVFLTLFSSYPFIFLVTAPPDDGTT